MKQLSRFFILCILLIPFWGMGQQAVDLSKYEGVGTANDLQVTRQIHPLARRAMAANEKPGVFKNVTYQLAGNVRVLTEQQTAQIRLKDDGVLDRNALTSFDPDPSTIYVDRTGGFAFQALAVDDEDMMILKPGLSSIFKEFNLPTQEVALTLANTTESNNEVTTTSEKKADNYFIDFEFKNYKIVLDSSGKSGAFVTLNGSIKLTNPIVEASYTKNNGYNLTFKAKQTLDLTADATIQLKKEVKVPIWGSSADIPDLGKCEIGLFAVVSMEGLVTLHAEIQQGLALQLGVKGGTFYYVPTSFKNNSGYDFTYYMDAELRLSAKMFTGFLCTAGMKVFGMNLINVKISTGIEATGKIEDNLITADAGIRANAQWKMLGEKKTLFDWYCSIIKFDKPNYAGYKMMIHEACAYGDYVAGQVWRAQGHDTLPYQGAVKVLVKKAKGGAPVLYNASSNDEGLFVVTTVPMEKGDQVALQMPGVQNVSPYMDVTIPFKEIRLYHADYYAGVAEGSVAARKSEWYQMAVDSKTEANPNAERVALNPGVVSRTGVDKAMVRPQSKGIENLEKLLANLVQYSGPVSFETMAVNTLQPMNQPKTGTRTGRKPGHSATSGKASINHGMIKPVAGNFAVKNLDFSPEQKVRATVNIDGFILHSEWVETEGLVFSAIEMENVQSSGSIGGSSLSADKSFVMVTPLRGESSPTGYVRILKGMNYSESLPSNETTTLQEFPTAGNAVLWFDETVALKSLPGKQGVAIGETAPWSVSWSLGPVSPDKFACNRPFEMVSYTYKNVDVGYSYIMDECTGPTAQDIKSTIEGLHNMKMQQKLQSLDTKKLDGRMVVPKVQGRFH